MKITEKDTDLITGVFEKYGIELPFETTKECTDFFQVIINIARPWKRPTSVTELLDPWVEVQGKATVDSWEDCKLIDGELYHNEMVVASYNDKKSVNLNAFKIR